MERTVKECCSIEKGMISIKIPKGSYDIIFITEEEVLEMLYMIKKESDDDK